jgi:hypothetical protein
MTSVIPLEDNNDRTASHRLCVKPSGSGPATVRTKFHEPYAPAKSRYDLDVRLFDEKGKASRIVLSVNGKAQGSAWESPAEGQGWMTHIVRDVEISAGDEIALRAEGAPCRLDYVQLNVR